MRENKVNIIAEVGVNHQGCLNTALEYVDICCEMGVDVVKFQTFQPKHLVAKSAKKAAYQKKNSEDSESQLELLERLSLSYKDTNKILSYCNKKGIVFLSSPFDMESASFLVNELALKTIKLGSGELTNAPLLYYLAQMGVSVILSTGMALLGEIEMALGVLAYGYLGGTQPCFKNFREAYISRDAVSILSDRVTLMHCTSSYPALPNEINLTALTTLQNAFSVPIGYSDHSEGVAVSLAAVALGACVIEKHITLDKALPGPDHKASLDPKEFRYMVSQVRIVEEALGYSYKIPQAGEMNTLEVARKSLVTQKTIKQGERFTKDNLTVKRPAAGISAMEYFDYLGRNAQAHYSEDELLNE